MATKIVTKNSSTASAVPTASDLVQGELAVNVADKRLFTEDNAGAIVELGTNPTTLNVNGTATMDGLTVEGNALVQPASGSAKLTLQTSNTTSDSQLIFGDSASNNIGGVKYSHSDDNMRFETAATERFRIAADGSLSTPTLGISNVRFGVNAGNSITSGGNYNTVVGDEAGTAITTGDYNVAVGYPAGTALTTGGGNVGIGGLSLTAASTGNNNTAVGFQASRYMTTASNTTAIGYLAGGGLGGATVMTGNDNTLVGASAGLKITTGAQNTAVGGRSQEATTTGGDNTSIGWGSLVLNTTGASNTALGRSSLAANTTASNNTAVGHHALLAITTGGYNTALGKSAGRVATSSYGTYVGVDAGYSNVTGSNHFFGANAGRSATGTGNTFIGGNGTGYGAGYFVTTGNNNTILGGFHGNQGGLDIRTASNHIVLSDGAGNPRLYIDNIGNLYNPSMPGSTATNSDVRFITSTGQIYYQTSSRRYKENIQDFPSTLDKVNALRPVTFDEIATGEQCYGLIAEEVFEQIPELVNLKEVEGYDEPQPDNIPYSMLSVFLLKAMQEQQTLIDSLTARIEALES
ncbi:tail fiber domain-containing protein [Gammaproteobacteria bacterium]|nr:tail fiber domain-containing protein [Gammaproteobacteria bacterium]